jgi:D-xylose transport system permease protein
MATERGEGPQDQGGQAEQTTGPESVVAPETAQGIAVANLPAEEAQAADAKAVTVAPDVLANSLSEYARAWLRRVGSGESGALPVIVGLIVIGAYFQFRSHAFLSAGNIANLMGQAGWIITIAMAQVFVLLLGEIDLSVGYNAAVGATITIWMVSVSHPFPTWLAIVVGLAVSTAIAALEGAIVAFLRIPSFVVTLAGLLTLSGVLLWLYEETGSVGLGGVIQNHNGFINGIVSENLSPAISWVVLIVVIVASALYMIVRDQRRRANHLSVAPLSITVLKLVIMAAVGVVLVVVLSLNRGTLIQPLSGVPWVVPVVLLLLAVTSVLLGRTKFGRYIYAIGGNAEAARRAGINLNRIRVTAFALAGTFAGITGILYASLLGSISNNVNGGQYVLYSVAGAVIGGVSLFGGRGRMMGAVLGGFVVAVIYNGVILLGLGAAGQYIWTGGVLLAAVLLDALARRGSTGATN